MVMSRAFRYSGGGIFFFGVASCLTSYLLAQTASDSKPSPRSGCATCFIASIISGGGQTGGVSTMLPGQLTIKVVSTSSGAPVIINFEFTLTSSPAGSTGASLVGGPGSVGTPTEVETL